MKNRAGSGRNPKAIVLFLFLIAAAFCVSLQPCPMIGLDKGQRLALIKI
jgi:hypothetical protein